MMNSERKIDQTPVPLSVDVNYNNFCSIGGHATGMDRFTGDRICEEWSDNEICSRFATFVDGRCLCRLAL